MLELETLFAREVPVINRVLSWWVEDLPAFVRPVGAYVLESGGKRLRPLLTILMARLLGCESEDAYVLGSAMEVMHTATLLHDDILDNSALRRGVPTAHTVYGTARVVLAGDALLAQALEKVAALGDTRLTGSIAQALVKTAGGEIAEMACAGDTEGSLERYLEIITGKTAWMLRTACALGAMRAGANPTQLRAAKEFGLQLGVAFQMVDDALDFIPGGTTGKPVGGDLREGKMTPPLYYYLAGLPESEASLFRQRFSNGEFSDEEVGRISLAIHEAGGGEKTRQLAGSYLDKALEALSALPENNERALLEKAARFIGLREQ